MIVGAYVRVSTQEQANEGFSVGEQTDRLKKYCEAHDWKIYQIYTDAGFTGANMERPALQQMMRDIKAGRIQKVVVWKLDRLSRSQKDTLSLIEDCFLANDCDFVSMRENFDTGTPFGNAIIGILAVFAQLEREQIKERMAMGKDARVKSGKWTGGSHVPFGYKYVDGEIIVDDYEAMIVKEMFRLVLEGNSVYSICKQFNAKGYRTALNAEFQQRTMKRMLTSQVYIGMIKFKKRWHPGTHEAIIDVDTFERAQDLLQNRLDIKLGYYKQNPGKVSSYLGGMLICAHCGAKYSKNIYASTERGKKYKYLKYTCNSRRYHGNKHLVRDPECKNKTWNMDELDNLVFDQIRKLAVDPDHKDDVVSPGVDNSEILRKEIEKIDKQILRLMDLYQIGSIPIESIRSKVEEADQKKKKLEIQLSKAMDDQKNRLSVQEGLKYAANFDNLLQEGDFKEIRRVLTELIEYIAIDGDDIDIHWNF